MPASSDIQLRIPAAVAESLRLPDQRREETLQRELAIALYAQGILSFGKARELAAMSKAGFGESLADHGVTRHYGEDDVQDDIAYAGR